MGVMTCSRGDCTNILCEMYHNELGYICEECFSELKRLQKRYPQLNMEGVKHFMETNVSNFNEQPPLIDLDKLFEDN